MNGGPAVDVFNGVKVVEMAQWVFVPVAGSLLADWGADVIKIEHPVSGDGYRALFSQGLDRTTGKAMVNQSMELANRGKRSIGLDVKTPEGRDLLLRLVADADIFLTNFLPQTLRKLGLDVDDLRKVNPKIIYARGHGQGVRGPDAEKGAYDATAFWARGGLGETLTPPGMPLPIRQRGAFGDRNGAMQLAFGMAGALFRRERTGEPSIVDVSLLATAMWTLASDVLSALQGNFATAPVAGQASKMAPNPLVADYPTSDGRFLGFVFLQPDKHWGELARAIGHPELEHDARFADTAARSANRAELVEILTDIFRSRTLEEWKQAFAGERFPWAPFQRVPEILDDVQVAANGYIGDVETEDGTTYKLPTGAVQFDELPTALRRGPELGEHTETILLELGYDWDDIIKFKDAGVVN